MKRTFSLLFFACLAGIAPAEIVTRINGRDYTKEEMARFRKFSKLNTADTLGRRKGADRTRVIQNALKRELQNFETKMITLQDAEAAGTQVSEEEVKEERDRLAQRLAQIGPLDELVAEVGLTPEEFDELIEEEALREKRMAEKIVPTLKVTSEELDREYQNLLQALTSREYVKIQHIFCKIEDPNDASQVEEARRKAQGLRNRAVEEKVPFQALLAMSDDPKSVDPEHPNQFFKGARMLEQMYGPAVESETWKLKEGEISDPIRETGGYYLVCVLRREAPANPSKESVAQELERNILRRKRFQGIEAYRRALWKEAKIEHPNRSESPAPSEPLP